MQIRILSTRIRIQRVKSCLKEKLKLHTNLTRFVLWFTLYEFLKINLKLNYVFYNFSSFLNFFGTFLAHFGDFLHRGSGSLECHVVIYIPIGKC